MYYYTVCMYEFGDAYIRSEHTFTVKWY